MTRKRITVKGVVQGVGFRPHVYKLAAGYGLAGWVRNDAGGVTIEAEGPLDAVDGFIKDIAARAPAAARVDSVAAVGLRPEGVRGFSIARSGGRAGASAIIPADLALCPDCRRELLDPADRRYLYPFINCTNCGPRFTIVKSVPYDRPATTMASFRMCPECAAEYSDPLDRRFHAQPDACPACGPSVTLAYRGRLLRRGAALRKAAALLASGAIGALQSIGGFHLACRADSPASVARLRRAKRRPHKPFALMFPSLAAVRRHCFVPAAEAAALASPQAPAVMLRRRGGASFPGVAPGLSRLGVMLPYTPLHAALFELLSAGGCSSPLVMTSGNMQDEPICRSAGEAAARLPAAGFTLSHDRPIHNRADDSVAYYAAGALRLARRARGYVPEAVKLASSGPSVLACGADLKNAFCLTRGAEAFMSQHIGDMSEPLNRDFMNDTVRNLGALLKVKPAAVAYDLHPDYVSSAVGRALAGRKVPVQHHAAHALSVAAEHRLEGDFIGLVFDGTGYGSDGRIWGSEFLVFSGRSWRRAAHLKYFRLPGGDAAARELWRPALSLVRQAFGQAWRAQAGRLFSGVGSARLRTAERMMEAGVNSPETSGMGRLYDAFSFIAGVRSEATYEAQGPMELESLPGKGRPYTFGLAEDGGALELDPAPAVRAAVADRLAGRRPGDIGASLNRGLAAAAAAAAARLAAAAGTGKVCLSGGVFQNRALLELTAAALRRRGLEPLMNLQVPANDGGIALGQAWYALRGYRQAR